MQQQQLQLQRMLSSMQLQKFLYFFHESQQSQQMKKRAFFCFLELYGNMFFIAIP